jgi:ligand-binding sensor domain-containing protein
VRTICIVFLIFLLRFPVAIVGQMPIFQPFLSKELMDVKVNTIFQDKDGWIWLGTNKGLVCYDGIESRFFRLDDSIPNQSVTAIFEWNNKIMAGFRSGNIGFIDKKEGFWYNIEYKEGTGQTIEKKLQNWSPKEGTPTKPITDFCADTKGNLWISTYGEGLYCYQNERLYQFDAADDHLSNDEIYDLTADKNGQIWAATDLGISVCSMDHNNQKSVHVIGKAEGLQDEIILSLNSTPDGKIWIGSDENGWSTFNTQNQHFEPALKTWKDGAITSIAVYEPSELWFGTSENGLYRYNKTTQKGQFLPENHPLRHAKIQKIWKDQEGLLWVINDKGKIYRGNPQFSYFPSEAANVQAIWLDTQNRLWEGTENGLFLNENEQKRPMLNQNIISLHGTPDGFVLVGSFGDGLYLYDANAKLQLHLNEKNGLPNGSILSISYCEGKILLATLGGVTEVDWSASSPKKIGKVTHQGALGNSYVYKVFTDSRKRIWFGTDGKGLILFENGQFKTIGENINPTLKTIFSIIEDKKGNIWFTSDRQGLFCYDGSKFELYTEKNGLHSLQINGLAANAIGNIVIGYSDGLTILNPETNQCTFYETETGLPITDFALNSFCNDAYGQIWIGGKKGVLQLPAYREPFRVNPHVQMRSISLFMQPIAFQQKSNFNATENYFFFEFAGLWFLSPEAVQYRYQLDGFDPNWKITKDNKVSYPNLPPGEYTFRVQASEHQRFDNGQEAVYAFKISPPIYTRWWFVSLILGILAYLIYTFVHYREKRFQTVAKLQKEKAESQFETLKSQINPHFLFNSFNTLTTIIDENPETAIKYVENLSDFYRNVLEYRGKEFITLQEELDLVRNFEFLLKKRYESNLNIEIETTNTHGMIMPMTLQLLVENAVKHNIISQSKPLTIQVFVENKTHVVVKNNFQPKTHPEPSTRFGLQSLQNRYELLKGKKMVVEQNEKYFVVKVPIL